MSSRYSYKRKKTAGECGVWIPETQSFCGKNIQQYRRCTAHVAALKRDDLFENLRAMSPEQRETALDMLDNVQKIRPRWQYEPQDELPEV